MRKIKLYIACSLNGKIAKKDGDVEWLNKIPNPDNTDHGYAQFYDSVESTIQGYKTYKQILDWGIDFPYKGKKNFVLTRNKNLENTENVEFVTNNHIAFVKDIKKQKGKDIWLIGGGQINTMLWNEKLIDELIVFIMPIVLSEGIDLFESVPEEGMLQLFDSKVYASGVVEMRYRTKVSK